MAHLHSVGRGPSPLTPRRTAETGQGLGEEEQATLGGRVGQWAGLGAGQGPAPAADRVSGRPSGFLFSWLKFYLLILVTS